MDAEFHHQMLLIFLKSCVPLLILQEYYRKLAPEFLLSHDIMSNTYSIKSCLLHLSPEPLSSASPKCPPLPPPAVADPELFRLARTVCVTYGPLDESRRDAAEVHAAIDLLHRNYHLRPPYTPAGS